MLSISQALVATLAMALVIFLCRALPFIFFSKDLVRPWQAGFIAFVEKLVPPVAMTVLASTAIVPAFAKADGQGLATGLAVLFTALAHLWKRNALLSIFGGTAIYMLLSSVI